MSQPAEQTATLDFTLELTVERHEITVTASGREEMAFESVQTVESLNSFDLSETAGASLGEILDSRPGSAVAKRSFGPGSSRPIIRGFDGDRVLVMQDGIRTGTLSSQSGDHGELMNTASLDRLEALRLYTISGAWFSRDEDRLGSIEPGKLADIVVLSDDFLDTTRVPDAAIKRLQSVLTIVGGRIVHDTGALTRQ